MPKYFVLLPAFYINLLLFDWVKIVKCFLEFETENQCLQNNNITKVLLKIIFLSLLPKHLEIIDLK